MLEKVEDLAKLAKKTAPIRMGVVFAHDPYVIEAVAKSREAGDIFPVLIGNQEKIKEILREEALNMPCEIIDENDPDQASRIAMDLVNDGEIQVIMKGLLDTKNLLKAVVNKESGIREKTLLSHVGLVSYPGFNRVLFVTDGAMNIDPGVEEKIMIIENAVELAHSLGYDNPAVGIVSAVEKVNPKIQSTVDASQIIKHYEENPPKGFVVDGPFAIDNLVSEESVKHKGIVSMVAGHADILLFPNLDGGNIFYKTSVFLAGAHSAGIVLGAKVPIVLTSRADTAMAKYNSILLAVVNHYGLRATDN
ncbi:MAG TPA: bifunctional enoyl-CoA hydratase/phosphate acetyltransferase [Bacillota bacterium]|nr:bifunctional enoyl-CoA hydratase/phosphate acetyltransferase [Bacillota bacterium]HPF42344.1 bifunctional enoyl-CoA hydratase/phosphate acetyltransferase [Bacillota bacterium]HPQ61383.1 bifunctional enoyl-CoA hydratase/phosphate acetyltransferase [Bacillota bacterium]HRX92247.1 bifunctional enoyl-CoA hydratase/phosphate acetyltransferase [Candidatus Izemoplasmatales bacterium]